MTEEMVALRTPASHVSATFRLGDPAQDRPFGSTACPIALPPIGICIYLVRNNVARALSGRGIHKQMVADVAGAPCAARPGCMGSETGSKCLRGYVP